MPVKKPRHELELTDHQTKKRALNQLAMVYKDLEMLRDGVLPLDPQNIEADLLGLRTAVRILEDCGALPRFSSVVAEANKL
jgi:hypothetical protein